METAKATKLKFILDDDDNATCPVCGCTEVWNKMDNGRVLLAKCP
jgi:hypothetical protein